MHRLLSALVVCAVTLTVTAQQVPFRLVASDIELPPVGVNLPSPLGTGPDGLGAAPAPDYANGDANGNPVIVSGGSTTSQTLNLWVEVAPPQHWLGVGFNIYTTGDLYAEATAEQFTPSWSVRAGTGKFRVNSGDELAYHRWADGSILSGDSNGNLVQAASVPGVAGFGSGIGGDGDPGVGATTVYDPGAAGYVVEQRGTWFKLGTVTVTGSTGQVFLGYQPTTYLGGEKGDGIMHYGWNATGIVNIDDNLGLASDVPLISVVIPEPATLLPLILLTLVVRRR